MLYIEIPQYDYILIGVAVVYGYLITTKKK